MPRSGDVLYITKAASVQFIDPFLFRVIRVHNWPTYDDWMWLDGYRLNTAGDAVERRTIWTQIAGLRHVGETPRPPARNTGPVVPRPRTPSDTTVTTAGRTR